MAKSIVYISAKPYQTKSYYVNVETFILVFIYRFTNNYQIQLQVTLDLEATEDEPLLKCDLSDVTHVICQDPPDITKCCKWPLILTDMQIIAGLCAVARFLLKNSDKEDVRQLLGFRKACLLSCSESSVWTRFCEVEIIAMTKAILKGEFLKGDKCFLPKEIARFEYHMSKPVRMHNVYKEARKRNNNKSINSSLSLEELKLEHVYSEGMFMTLADLILYPCFNIFFVKCGNSLLDSKIPLVTQWFETIKNASIPTLTLRLPTFDGVITEVIEPEFVKQSLYTSDPSRYRPEKRVHTKQHNIDSAFELLKPIEHHFRNANISYGIELEFSWQKIPPEANPLGGALPPKRADRKCEQLENIARAVMAIAGDKNYVIVDFCSGSGHVGILLAVVLPNSKILLVENKENSLSRAKERIKKLGINNVTIVQSNLDYYVGNFDVGVALHACGVATDLVIETCIRNRAHFVVCPCCYGGVKDCHHLSYPRSNIFKCTSLSYDDYLCLAHAADQTHDDLNQKTRQGYFCMDVIDTDRSLYAGELGYEVFLGKLQPTTCTNKNNLLVGIHSEKV